jgi:hypothetical protein
MNGWDIADPNVWTLTCLAQSGCEAQAIVAGDSDPANRTWCSLNTSLLKNPLGDDLVLSSAIKLLQEAAENLKGPTPRPFFVGPCQQPAVCHAASPSGSASVLTWRAARTVLVQVSGFTSRTCRGIFRLSLGTFTMWRTSNRQSTRTHRKGCRSWRGTNPGVILKRQTILVTSNSTTGGQSRARPTTQSIPGERTTPPSPIRTRTLGSYLQSWTGWASPLPRWSRW